MENEQKQTWWKRWNKYLIYGFGIMLLVVTMIKIENVQAQGEGPDVTNDNVFVQSGTISLGGLVRSNATVVKRVENNSAFLVYTIKGNSVDPATGNVIVFLQNQTLINVSRTGSASVSTTQEIWWYLINMTGIQVTRGKVRGNSLSQINITIPGINTTGAFLIANPGMGGAQYGGDDFPMAEIVNTSQIRFSVSTGEDFGSASNEIEYQLVNATNGNFRVQQVSVNFGLTQLIANVSLPTPVNLSKSFLLSSHKWQSVVTGLMDGESKIVPYFKNNTNIQVNRTSSFLTQVDLNVTIFAVEFADSSFVQSGIENLSLSLFQVNRILNPAVNLSSSFPVLSNFMSRGLEPDIATDEIGSGRFGVNFTNTTQISFTRNLTNSRNAIFAWFVIQLNTSFAPPPAAAADTCTYVSGDWNMNCYDNCTITTTNNIANNNLILSGRNGNPSIKNGGSVTNINQLIYNLNASNCYLHVEKGGLLQFGR